MTEQRGKKTTEPPLDFPFDEVCKTADELAKRGGLCYQKWTCGGCGQRLTAGTPNYFTKKGHCEHCGFITDLVERGCNYMLIWTGGV